MKKKILGLGLAIAVLAGSNVSKAQVGEGNILFDAYLVD